MCTFFIESNLRRPREIVQDFQRPPRENHKREISREESTESGTDIGWRRHYIPFDELYTGDNWRAPNNRRSDNRKPGNSNSELAEILTVSPLHVCDGCVRVLKPADAHVRRGNRAGKKLAVISLREIEILFGHETDGSWNSWANWSSLERNLFD